jgi:energy-coupling factor transporter ATP-binding protein EcfA2
VSLSKSQYAISEERRFAEFHMIRSLKAENFRCFEEISLPDLRRINVLVGKNATGKSALLEVVRLALGGTPAVLWAMNQIRGFIPAITQPPSREQFEAIWSPYFFDFNSNSPIYTECQDNNGRKATLKVSYDPQKSVTTVPQSQPPGAQPIPISTIVPMAFERVDFSGRSSTLYASVNVQGAYIFDPGPELGVVTEFFPSFFANPQQQAAQWFSQLSVQKREKGIVDAVREEFEPALENLMVLAPGPAPAIFASVKYLKEKLPLSLMSAGINRFVTLLAAILIRGKGVLLIDEVENGLFYKTLPSLWKYLLKFAVENDTQLFVSTHSLECVRAMIPAMQGMEEEFSLLRSERTNGSSTVAQIQGKFLEAAIEQGVEVR